MHTITCIRCKKDGPPLEKAPFKNAIGKRIREEICQTCWGEWLEHQTLLINHYGLDPRDPKAQAFLFNQVETVLLGGGDAKQVDTSQEGNVSW